MGLLLEAMRPVEEGGSAAGGGGDGDGGGTRFGVGFVRYARSALCTGMRDSSVSYCSALVV